MKKNNLGKLNKICSIFLVFTMISSWAYGLIPNFEKYTPGVKKVEAATENKYADAHITGGADNPNNALGALDFTYAGVLNTNIDWTSRWSMENPSGTITGTQTINVEARKGSNSNIPTIAINLYENGSLIQSVAAATDVTSTVSQTISGTFDASVITNLNNVEIEIVQNAMPGSGSAKNSAQIDSIQWVVNLATVVAPTVTTSAASSITASTATLNGNITATGNANPTIRGFASSTDSTLSTGVATSTESGSFSTGIFTGSMGGLSGNATYYFRAYATNSAGTGYSTPILSFLTLPNAPGTPTFSNITNNAMRVSWSAPTGGATSYKVERCTGAGCSGFSQIATGETNTFYDDSGLSASTVYRYRIRATNATGDGAYSGEAEQSTAAETTLGDGTDPGNTTIAPGASVTDLDAFTLQTTSGIDTVTAVTVTLSPSTATTTISKIEVTDNSNVDVCTDIDVDGSTSNVLNFSGCSLDVTTSATTYKVRITPKIHANMPVVPGAEVAVTGTITSITATTNATTGTDTDSATVTVDNLSPGNVTGSSASPGNTQNGLAWTNPADSDLSKIMVLASTTAVTFTPVEGTTYATSTLAGASRVACYGLQVSCTDNADGAGLVNGTAYYYKIFALDSNGNWSETGVEPSGSPTTPVEPITTLTDGSNPSSVTIAPGGTITDLNRFILTTNTGTDAITSVTVTLSSNVGVGTLTVTNNADSSLGSIGGGTGSGIVTGANAVSISSTNAVTGGATFKVRVTPLSHANMPAVPGAENALTGAVTDWSGTNTKAGQSNDTSATVTIDNASPANVTSSTATAGDTLVNLAWTNPADSDLSKIMVLASTTAVTFVPVEGTTYATSTPYNIASGSFTQIALSVSAQEAVPRDMLFNNDGTKLYVMGSFGDDINEYALSTPYSISTGSFTQIALSIAEDTVPTAMLFNNDGTKLYVLGSTGDDINEYALSTPYSISTGSFTQIALSVATEETGPTAMLFNNDGTKLYVMGGIGDDINEYALSTPYSISTGSFTQIALSVSAQESAPYAMLFNNDGTKLYVLGSTGDDINEYALSTAYDISSGSFTQIALSVSAQETDPNAMLFNNDGTELYVLGQIGQDINEYALTLNGASRVACYGLQVSCTDTSLVNGTAYYYKIFTLDSNGNWSETGVEPSGSPTTPAVPGEILSQAHYRWRNDDSGDASATYKQTEDTALTSDIFVGDRLRLRLSVANSGGVGTGLEFLLEHSSTTCSVWIPVPTSNGAGTHWSVSNSPYFADGTATADSSGLTNPGGMSFVSGFLHDNTNITSGMTLNTNEFTELEYSVQSTGAVEAGIQYCFRVSNNGDTGTFTFDVTPSITLSSLSIRPQGGGGGNYGTIPGQESGSGPQQSGGGAGGESGGGTGEGSGSGGQETGGGGGGGGGGDLGFLPNYPFSLLSLKIFDLADFSLAQLFRIFR